MSNNFKYKKGDILYWKQQIFPDQSSIAKVRIYNAYKQKCEENAYGAREICDMDHLDKCIQDDWSTIEESELTKDVREAAKWFMDLEENSFKKKKELVERFVQHEEPNSVRFIRDEE